MGYIRFDVDKIKDFVFESYRPVEVTGASEMIKLLDKGGPILEKLKTHFQDTEAEVVYSRGGGGLMRVSQREKDICHWLQEEYAETVKGGKLTAVHCKASDGFPITYALLNYKLRELKNQKALLRPPEKTVKFAQEDSQRRCSACGKRKAKEKIEVSPGEELHYCEVCLKKRLEGQKQKDKKKAVNTLEDLLTSIPGVKDSTYLLMIYGDLNKAGDLFASMEEEDDLRNLSKQIFETLEKAREDMGKKLWERGFKSLMPVAGGDDLIIFIHPAAFGLIKDDLFNLEKKLYDATGKELKMNFSFLVAKQNFPIYHLFQTSEILLKETKKKYYQKEDNDDSFYGFIWLEEGGFRPSGKDVYQKEEFKTLCHFAQKIHSNNNISTSTLHQLLDLLPVTENEKEKKHSKPEEQFNIAYLLARNDALDKMLIRDDEGYRIKEEKDLKVTRDLWEDIIDMKELFMIIRIRRRQDE